MPVDGSLLHELSARIANAWILEPDRVATKRTSLVDVG
jgi:hypothetical protein